MQAVAVSQARRFYRCDREGCPRVVEVEVVDPPKLPDGWKRKVLKGVEGDYCRRCAAGKPLVQEYLRRGHRAKGPTKRCAICGGAFRAVDGRSSQKTCGKRVCVRRWHNVKHQSERASRSSLDWQDNGRGTYTAGPWVIERTTEQYHLFFGDKPISSYNSLNSAKQAAVYRAGMEKFR